jgi:catechol 2,3-dioxygenase-like lactoylglutathione lyase family enzyme
METRKTLHVSLNVADLPAAIASYRKILGIEPAKVRPDYAKFELADPPVVLSLNPSDRPGTVGHLGIRYAGTGDVATELVRVRTEAMDVLEQASATCCYVTADKFWVRDADGMPWEMYAVTADAEVHSAPSPQPSTTDTPSAGCCAR